jgi:hypothetical protein
LKIRSLSVENVDKMVFTMKSKFKKILIVVLIVLIAGVFAWGTFSGAFNSLITRDLANTSEKFLAAVKTDDYDTAFSLCSSAFQKELGSVDGLREGISHRDAIPVEWKLNLFRMKGNNGEVEGTGNLTRGRRAVINIALARENHKWLVSGFLIEEQ